MKKIIFGILVIINSTNISASGIERDTISEYSSGNLNSEQVLSTVSNDGLQQEKQKIINSVLVSDSALKIILEMVYTKGQELINDGKKEFETAFQKFNEYVLSKQSLLILNYINKVKQQIKRKSSLVAPEKLPILNNFYERIKIPALSISKDLIVDYYPESAPKRCDVTWPINFLNEYQSYLEKTYLIELKQQLNFRYDEFLTTFYNLMHEKWQSQDFEFIDLLKK